MVVNNPDSGSGGAKDGLLAFAAIAVVLFFVIRIYSDYVTATGQAVKPGTKRTSTSYTTSRRDADTAEEPTRTAGRLNEDQPYDAPRTRRTKPQAPSVDDGGAEDVPERHTEPDPESAQTFAADSSGSAAEPLEPRHSAESRRLGHAKPAEFGRTIATRSRRPVPPEPRIANDPDDTDSPATVRTVLSPAKRRTLAENQPERADNRALSGAALRRSLRTPLFQASEPYPAEVDDIQIGDRLSQISDLGLPGGRLSRSVYTYHPRGGPFKTVLAMFAIGPVDPVVTGVVYVFRNARHRDEVRRQAMEAFGEGDATENEHSERRQWSHRNGYTIVLDRDRYTIDQDMSRAGRRSSRRSSAAGVE